MVGIRVRIWNRLRNRGIVPLALLATLAGTWAHAQAPVPGAAPPDPPANAAPPSNPAPISGNAAEKAAANAEAAKRLIYLAGLSDVFVPLPDPDRLLAVHPASGLVCPLKQQSFGDELFLASTALNRGDDVGCRAQGGPNGEFTETIFVTRLPGVEDYQWFLGALDDIMRIWKLHPDQKGLPGFQLEGEPLGSRANFRAYPPKGVHFDGTKPGDPAFTSVRVIGFGDWKFKQRLTAPITAAVDAARFGRVIWIETLFRRKQYFKAPPAAEPRPVSPAPATPADSAPSGTPPADKAG